MSYLCRMEDQNRQEIYRAMCKLKDIACRSGEPGYNTLFAAWVAAKNGKLTAKRFQKLADKYAPGLFEVKTVVKIHLASGQLY